MHQHVAFDLFSNMSLSAPLGEGRFGRVLPGYSNSLEVAMKIVDLTIEDNQLAFETELEALAQLKKFRKQNKFVCEILDFGADESSGFVLMKKYDTDLFDFTFKDQTKMSEVQAQKIFRCICKGLKVLHKGGIAHLDLKPENILIDTKSEKAFICDFGASWVSPKRRKSLDDINPIPCLGRRGSARYASPEMAKNPDSYDPYRSDVFSLGVLLHALLLGYFPPPHALRATTPLDYLEEEGLSPSCCLLLKNMLEVKPEQRISINKVVKHKWLSTRTAKKLSTSI